MTFTATTTNFPGSVSYVWATPDTPTPTGGGGGGGGTGCELNHSCFGASSIAVVTDTCTDTDTCSHTYTAVGTYVVTVTATSGATTRTASRNITITLGGPPAPSNAFSVVGATFNGFNGTWDIEAGRTFSVSATEADPDATFAWDFGDGATGTGRSATHAYATTGIKTMILTATGGGTLTSGTSTSQARFNVSPPSFQAIMIPGAGSIFSDAGDWATDISITNPDTQSTTVTLYFAAFTDDIPSDLSTLPFDSLNSVPARVRSVLVGRRRRRHDSRSGGPRQGHPLPEVPGRHADRDGPRLFHGRRCFLRNGAPVLRRWPVRRATVFRTSSLRSASTSSACATIRATASTFRSSTPPARAGSFHLEAFTEDGESVASKNIAVPAYSQYGVNDTDLFTPNPEKRYVLKATSTTGSLQAYASQLDRNNNDLVQVSDDTPRVAAVPDTQINYYVSGVGRIESATNNAHWRTDLRFFNPSSLSRNLTLEFHYTPGDTPAEQVAVAQVTVGAGKGLSIDDVVGNPAGSTSTPTSCPTARLSAC